MPAPASSPAASRARPVLPLLLPRLPVGALLAALFRRDALRRTRHRLAELDAHLLADIGVTRDQAEAEASRPATAAPAWDAPARWREG